MFTSMQLFHSSKHLQIRDMLLQKSLRPASWTIPIADEYPTVLSESAIANSYVLANERGDFLAHANLLPRQISDSPISLGLVGNVATAPEVRGKGLCRQLFCHLESQAQDLGIDALLLWTDLDLFYQKLGFQAVGKEYRLTFSRATLQNLGLPNLELRYYWTRNLKSDDPIPRLFHPIPTLTLARSQTDFQTLLTIPEMLMISNLPSQSYFLIGKGYDMQGVIHEWACPDPKILLAMILQVLSDCQGEILTLLSPGFLPESWKNLPNLAYRSEICPMGYMKFVAGGSKSRQSQLRELEESFFVWGLDSI